MTQQSLFGETDKKPKIPGATEYRFNGPEYIPKEDDARLGAQCERIFHVMKDNEWRTYAEIAVLTRDPENSISAQLRNLRKKPFGSHTLNRRKRRREGKRNLYEYQLIVNEPKS